jgi:hypothetical protein
MIQLHIIFFFYVCSLIFTNNFLFILNLDIMILYITNNNIIIINKYFKKLRN